MSLNPQLTYTHRRDCHSCWRIRFSGSAETGRSAANANRRIRPAVFSCTRVHFVRTFARAVIDHRKCTFETHVRFVAGDAPDRPRFRGISHGVSHTISASRNQLFGPARYYRAPASLTTDRRYANRSGGATSVWRLRRFSVSSVARKTNVRRRFDKCVTTSRFAARSVSLTDKNYKHS